MVLREEEAAWSQEGWEMPPRVSKDECPRAVRGQRDVGSAAVWAGPRASKQIPLLLQENP